MEASMEETSNRPYVFFSFKDILSAAKTYFLFILSNEKYAH